MLFYLCNLMCYAKLSKIFKDVFFYESFDFKNLQKPKGALHHHRRNYHNKSTTNKLCSFAFKTFHEKR